MAEADFNRFFTAASEKEFLKPFVIDDMPRMVGRLYQISQGYPCWGSRFPRCCLPETCKNVEILVLLFDPAQAWAGRHKKELGLSIHIFFGIAA